MQNKYIAYNMVYSWLRKCKLNAVSEAWSGG